jgi:hypothetical protein
VYHECLKGHVVQHVGVLVRKVVRQRHERLSKVFRVYPPLRPIPRRMQSTCILCLY